MGFFSNREYTSIPVGVERILSFLSLSSSLFISKGLVHRLRFVYMLFLWCLSENTRHFFKTPLVTNQCKVVLRNLNIEVTLWSKVNLIINSIGPSLIQNQHYCIGWINNKCNSILGITILNYVGCCQKKCKYHLMTNSLLFYRFQNTLYKRSWMKW